MLSRLFYGVAPFLFVPLLALSSANRADGPHPLKPADYAVGRLVADLSFTDLDGKAGKLSDYRGYDALVIALNHLTCPIARKYAPTLNAIHKEYAARNVAFLIVNVDQHATVQELRDGIRELGFTARYLPDLHNEISAALFAKSTTEVFVLDKARTLIYRGPFDDQFGIGYSLPAPRKHLLKDALNAHLGGKQIPCPAWSAPGCLMDLDVPSNEPPATYHNRISRIVQHHCQRCHRTGEIAPFPLMNYQDIQRVAPTIDYMVTKKLMPPWFANPAYGDWANDPTLAASDREVFLKWLKGDMPQGDPADAPLPIAWTPGWKIGEPDAVIELPAPIQIPETGVMPYQYVTVDNPFPEDKWVGALEIRPTAPTVVHHVLVFLKLPGQNELGVDNYFAAMVPGNAATELPKGVGKKLPKDAKLIFQLHYTPVGVATQDRTKLGLKFLPTPPAHEMVATAVYTKKFLIPAGHPNYEVSAEHVFKERARLFSFMPHMHLRGKAFRYELIRPDGTSEVLLDVPQYNFNWQLSYERREPLDVEVGTRIKATGWFDNSDQNPSNPDPTVDVGFGEQTTDEMMIGYFTWHKLP